MLTSNGEQLTNEIFLRWLQENLAGIGRVLFMTFPMSLAKPLPILAIPTTSGKKQSGWVTPPKGKKIYLYKVCRFVICGVHSKPSYHFPTSQVICSSIPSQKSNYPFPTDPSARQRWLAHT